MKPGVWLLNHRLKHLDQPDSVLYIQVDDDTFRDGRDCSTSLKNVY